MINTFKLIFCYFHGNHTKKVHVGPIKIAHPFHFNFWETPWSKINPSGPNGASKSAIQNFQVSMATVFNFDEFWGIVIKWATFMPNFKFLALTVFP